VQTNKPITLAAFFLLLFAATVFAQKTNTVKPFNNNFSMSLPDNCTLLSDAEAAKLYPVAGSRPTALYGTATRDLLVGLTLTQKAAPIDKMIENKKELVDGLKSRPMVSWLGDEVKTINGQKYIICSFTKRSPAGETNFNKMVISTLNGKMFICTITIAINITPGQKSKMDNIIASFKM
jgi:hypothetical protein